MTVSGSLVGVITWFYIVPLFRDKISLSYNSDNEVYINDKFLGVYGKVSGKVTEVEVGKFLMPIRMNGLIHKIPYPKNALRLVSKPAMKTKVYEVLWDTSKPDKDEKKDLDFEVTKRDNQFLRVQHDNMQDEMDRRVKEMLESRGGGNQRYQPGGQPQ